MINDIQNKISEDVNSYLGQDVNKDIFIILSDIFMPYAGNPLKQAADDSEKNHICMMCLFERTP